MFKVGKITNYYPKTKTAVIELVSDLFVGDMIKFVSDQVILSEQEASEITIGYKKENFAKAGSVIGLKTNEEFKPQTEVYKS